MVFPKIQGLEYDVVMKMFQEDQEIADLICYYGEWNQTTMWEKINERLLVLIKEKLCAD